jgi:hypothetical protein
MFVVSTETICSADSSRAECALATTGAIDRTATIHLAFEAVSSDANAGLNADTPRAHTSTGSDADTDCAGTNARRDTGTGGTGTNARCDADTGGTSTKARRDADTARAPALSPFPNTALRRAICVTVNSGFSRRHNQR